MSRVFLPSIGYIGMIIVASAYIVCGNPRAARATAVSCLEAASYAEHSLLLPVGLLESIGSVETGNRPWSVNVDGNGRSFTSAREAVSFARAATMSGSRYVDVGCFQIDLFYHPDAFASLEAAFDPIANAMAAGHFLLSLQRATSSWFDAVGRYHSSLPPLATPYATRVYAALNNTILGAPQPKTEMDDVMFGMRIIIPTPRGTLHSSTIRLAGLPTMQTP